MCKVDRRLSRVDAAKQLGLTQRHISRLVNAFERDDATALVCKRRGHRSSHAYADAVRTLVLGLGCEHYADFGPTLIVEKLAEKHEVVLSRETFRLWLMDAGLWQSRKQRDEVVHHPRNRRECLGELVQIDGSEHVWFEGRGPRAEVHAPGLRGRRHGATDDKDLHQQQIQAVERSKKAPARRSQRRSASERFRETNPAVG